MKKRGILYSTLVLSASALFVRMIGFFFRVYLSNTLGSQGMGLYSLIMSVYSLSITLATSGISTAVSKLAAEQFALGSAPGARKLLRRAIAMSLFLSCAVGCGLFFFSDAIALNILRDARTTLSLRLLAPGLPFLSVCACMRGYFIASRRVAVPASGQVIEQLFKMCFIMSLLGPAMDAGIERGCALVVLGITLGEAVCMLYTAVGYMIHKKRNPARGKAGNKGVVGKILRFAAPISISSYFRSFMRLLEDVLIVSGMSRFSGTQEEATGTYGMLRGMVMPLLIFPLNLLSAFVITLTPEVSRLSALSEKKKLEAVISRILQVTSILGIFVVCLLMSFSYEIGVAVYKDPQVGRMLRMMAFLTPFMCIETVVVSILQGMGEQTHSSAYGASDCVLRVILVWLLMPRFGVMGFVMMVVASNLFTSMLNLIRLLRITRIPVAWRDWIFKPLLAAMAASQAVKAVCNLVLFGAMPIWLTLILGVIVIAIVYIAVLFAVGSMTMEDIRWAARRFRPGPGQMHAVSQKGAENA
ncbi:MAG: polysaccharide biosynthesis protein [Oscillospiraceae bacterium]|jgi:stage V sporulation protein B|nr:polysaccharide biosynthesis protein [Oscillospiraceae bacterium]